MKYSFMDNSDLMKSEQLMSGLHKAELVRFSTFKLKPDAEPIYDLIQLV